MFEQLLSSTSGVVLVTVLLAIIPTVAWFLFYYWQYRKFSIPVLISIGVFFMGIVAVFGAILIQRPLLEVLSPVTRQFLEGRLFELTAAEAFRGFILAFLIAAPSEELLKMAGIFAIAYPSKRYFNRNFDGLLMGILAGLGFAFVENIVYFYPLAQSGEYQVLFGSFILRFFVSTVAHCMYSGTAGFFIAKSKLNPSKRGRYLFYAFLIPIIMHGLFNFFLFTRVVYYALFLVAVAVFLMWRVVKNRKNLEVGIRGKEVLKVPFFRDEAFEDQRYKAMGYFREASEDSIADFRQNEVLQICPRCFIQNRTQSNFCVNCHQNLIKQTHEHQTEKKE